MSWVFNKVKNNYYYYNVLLEKGLYQSLENDDDKHVEIFVNFLIFFFFFVEITTIILS